MIHVYRENKWGKSPPFPISPANPASPLTADLQLLPRCIWSPLCHQLRFSLSYQEIILSFLVHCLRVCNWCILKPIRSSAWSLVQQKQTVILLQMGCLKTRCLDNSQAPLNTDLNYWCVWRLKSPLACLKGRQVGFILSSEGGNRNAVSMKRT